jgi:hypothetical protein
MGAPKTRSHEWQSSLRAVSSGAMTKTDCLMSLLKLACRLEETSETRSTIRLPTSRTERPPATLPHLHPRLFPRTFRDLLQQDHSPEPVLERFWLKSENGQLKTSASPFTNAPRRRPPQVSASPSQEKIQPPTSSSGRQRAPASTRAGSRAACRGLVPAVGPTRGLWLLVCS